MINLLSEMEFNGIKIDKNYLQTLSKKFEKRIKKIEEEIYSLAGKEFNIGSPKQLQSILYEKLKLPILKKTPKGQPSTAEPVLQELAEKFELPKFLLIDVFWRYMPSFEMKMHIYLDFHSIFL